MYGTCNFNSLKFNSVCLRQIIQEEIDYSASRIKIRQRRRKVLYKQFFDIIGIKLIFNQEFFNLLGFLLLAHKFEYVIDARLLKKIQEYFLLIGQKQFPLKTEIDIVAFKKFLVEEKIDIKTVKLFLSKINYELAGIKLNNLIHSQEITGKKKFDVSDSYKFYGEKDIKALLVALDLIDEE